MSQKPFDEKNLADVVRSWFAYHIAVNRPHVLSEESIRYPVCDYLAQYTPNLKLEQKINDFTHRDFDLHFEYEGVKYYFEFKFAREKYTRNNSEIKRVFFDLLRLNSVSSQEKTKCFFLMVGDKHPFINEFVNLGKEAVGVDSASDSAGLEMSKRKRGRQRMYSTQGLYDKMFLFQEDASGNVGKLVSLGPEGEEFKNAFVKEYKLSDGSDCSEEIYNNLSNVKTSLIECSVDDRDGSRVGLGLWQIEHA